MWWLKGVSARMNLIRLALTFGRLPDKVISKPSSPGLYLCRWHVVPHNRWFNIYLHWFNQSDDDRALHDHPRWNMSWILDGEYDEITPGPNFFHAFNVGSSTMEVLDAHVKDVNSVVVTRKKAGFRNRVTREAWASHRIMLVDEKPVWTLFFVGKWVREWGFWCKDGWVDNDVFEAYGCGDSPLPNGAYTVTKKGE